MAVVRKVESKVKKTLPTEPEVARSDQEEPRQEGRVMGRRRVCSFCEGKNEPHYWDAAALRRFMSDRGRIIARQRSGVCSKHQRRVAQEVKRARHLALLPFTIGI